jgi:hypothetical protein
MVICMKDFFPGLMLGIFLCGLLAIGLKVALGDPPPSNQVNLDQIPHVEFVWNQVELEEIATYRQFWTQDELKKLVMSVRAADQLRKLMIQQQVVPMSEPPKDSSFATNLSMESK